MIPPVVFAAAAAVACLQPVAHDGDGPIHCAGDPIVIRLNAIEAPEVAGSPKCKRPALKHTPTCDIAAGERAKAALQRFLDRAVHVTYVVVGPDYYRRRTDAHVYVDGIDVECLMVAGGYAWVKYARLDCPPARRR